MEFIYSSLPKSHIVVALTMSLLSLPTDWHDARVDQFTFEPLRGRLTIRLWLDVAEGVSVVCKQLLLSGISNGQQVMALQQQIERVNRKGKRRALNYRLENFSSYPLLPLNKAELAIRLAIDQLPVLIIQCTKLTIQELSTEKTSC
jgi:hypothetical protein